MPEKIVKGQAIAGLMMKIECDGIIFDVDGTLWDSTFVVKDAWNQAIQDVGYKNPNITADRLKGLFGLPMDDIIKDLMPELSKEERDELAPTVYRYEDEYLEAKSGILYDKIIDVIIELSKKMPVYIVSNCQGGYIELFMRKTGCQEYIKDHLCPADTGKLKAGNITQIIEQYNIKNPIYVGDTVMDERACKEAGCPFCFAKYGFGKAQEPEYAIETPEDLLKMFS